ncbi:holin [Thiohalocapsa phage LS06-2018-MD04]|jgi:hypothetical protein|nr:holin [Thiohalocapsa phage LS06-2018-MD04]
MVLIFSEEILMNAKDLIAALALLAGLGAVWLVIEFAVEAFGPLVLVVSVVAIWTLLVLMVFKP